MASFLSRWAEISPRWLVSRKVEHVLLAIVLVLCAFGNLPWHLDNYDQAKQAYVSYEIEQGGSWWFQHTPRGDTATKPPFAGWISLGFKYLTGSWDIAWRLPGFLCTIALLWLLIREARRILPDEGALLVTCAFGLNFLTPRIATLVRTDMMLTLWITVCGILIYRKVASGAPWSTRERWYFFAAITAACFTKGPILYVFILPGLIAYFFLAPRAARTRFWCGWWPWVIPLLIFVAWGIVALKTNQEFYNDVVVKEFYSRFDQSLKSHEKQQPIWFYFPHLLHKFLPWSLFLIALPIASRNVRERIRQDPGTLWLCCWALGGLLLMTFVPSKRVDRIYPVIPPLALLFVAMIAGCRCGQRVRAWCAAAIVGALLMIGGYFSYLVIEGYIIRSDAMVRFGREAQAVAHAAGIERVEVVQGRDEAMILYGGGREYLHVDTAARRWREGKIDAVIVPERRLEGISVFPAPALVSDEISKNGETRYFLFLRRE